MKKIIIKNLQNIVTHAAQFETQELADAWILECVQTNTWGKAAGFYPINQLSEAEIAQEISRQTTSAFGDVLVFPLIEIPAQYTIEIADFTATSAVKSVIQKRAKKRSFGEYMVDKIAAGNEAKNLTLAQIEAFMNDSIIFSLREHLWAGNIDTFITKLTSSDVSAFFTTEEKDAVILECQNFITALG